MPKIICVQQFMAPHRDYIITFKTPADDLKYVRTAMVDKQDKYGWKVRELAQFKEPPHHDCFRVIVDRKDTEKVIEKFIQDEFGPKTIDGKEIEAEYSYEFKSGPCGKHLNKTN